NRSAERRSLAGLELAEVPRRVGEMKVRGRRTALLLHLQYDGIAHNVAVGDDLARRNDDAAAETHRYPRSVLAFDCHNAGGRFVEDLLGVQSLDAPRGRDQCRAAEQRAADGSARNHARLPALFSARTAS